MKTRTHKNTKYFLNLTATLNDGNNFKYIKYLNFKEEFLMAEWIR